MPYFFYAGFLKIHYQIPSMPQITPHKSFGAQLCSGEKRWIQGMDPHDSICFLNWIHSNDYSHLIDSIYSRRPQHRNHVFFSSWLCSGSNIAPMYPLSGILYHSVLIFPHRSILLVPTFIQLLLLTMLLQCRTYTSNLTITMGSTHGSSWFFCRIIPKPLFHLSVRKCVIGLNKKVK